MAGFLTPLRVERINGGNEWRVLEPFEYRVGAEDSHILVDVPVGFVTDFASIPRGLWNVFPPVGGKYDKAAVIHDRLYQFPYYVWDNDRAREVGIVKKFADDTFKEAMQVLGVSWLARNTIWLAVKLGGNGIWNRYRTEETE